MRIAVFALNSNFYKEVGLELRTHHQVKEYQHTNNETFNLANVQRLIDWCDLGYFEFAQYPLNILSNLEAMDKPLVVRGHGIELFSQAEVNWEKVNLLILTPVCKQIFLDQVPKSIPNILTLPIGIDPEFFSFSPLKGRKEFGKKILVQSTVIRPKKRIYTTIQTFGEIFQKDSGFTLWIVGNWSDAWKEATIQRQDEYNWPIRELIGSLGLDDAVIGTDQMPRELWKEFIMDKDIFWSNSILEGFHVSLAEHMATGGYPVINCWSGAESFYHSQWIHRSQSKMVEEILDWSIQPSQEKLLRAEQARTWISRPEFNVFLIARKIREAIEDVRKGKEIH